MSVYVDNALIPAEVSNGRVTHRSRWSHLVADTPRELHDFATRVLGLQRSYFQDHWPHPHYDLTEGKRTQALARGAQPIDALEAPEVGRWLPPVLLTSSRDGVTVADIEASLRPVFDPRKVLDGGAPGRGDQIGASLWQAWGGEVDVHRVSPAAWQHSRGAGYDRNAKMVEKVRSRGGECVAIVARCADDRCGRQEPHGTHGASHCADIAEKAGMPVHRAPVAAMDTVPPARPAAAAEAEARRHNWQAVPGDPDRKRCECEITAVRTRNPDGKGWTVTFQVPGFSPTTQVPPCLGLQRPREPAAQPTPEPGAEPSSQPPASHQGDIEPGRVIASGKHSETAQCGCGTTFQRPHGETYKACLGCEFAERLASAGIKPDDPGLTAIREWNRQVGASATRQAETDPVPAGESAPEPKPESQPGLEPEPDAGR